MTENKINDIYKEPFFDPVIEKDTNNINQRGNNEPEYAVNYAVAPVPEPDTSNNNPDTEDVLGNIRIAEENADVNNLLNVSNIPNGEFEPKNLIKTTVPPVTATRTVTLTYTKTSTPTNNNSYLSNNPKVPNIPNFSDNNNNNNPISSNNQNNNWNLQNNNQFPNQNYNQNINTNTNTNTFTDTNPNNNINYGNYVNEYNVPNGPNNIYNPNDPSYVNNNIDSQNDLSYAVDPSIIPNGNSYGYNSNLKQDVDAVTDNVIPESNKVETSEGPPFTYIAVFVAIPAIIIFALACLFLFKKFKNGKSSSNIAYPEDKIRKSNLFGTLQFWNANANKTIDYSCESRDSRTNFTSFSNERESKRGSNVPEYSEWLEAGGSNYISMPPVSPPPLPLDVDERNGLNGSNFAMGGTLNDVNTNNNNNIPLMNAEIDKPQAAKMAWKLEGMRVSRESQRKSERQSIFSSFQVW